MLAANGGLDWDALASAVSPETGCAFIQRSCGYSWRKSLGTADIRRAIDLIKMQNPNCKVMVDNCYGEFVEISEPSMVGADLIADSLIKNPGGTIAPCGGYVAGKKDLVAAAAARLSAPGLGVEFGSAPDHVMRALFQGLFLAPQMVGEAIKGGLLIAEVMSVKGYIVQPLPRVPRHDIVQAVELGNRERLIAFCEVVQQTCPVGSFIKPTAGETPGYASENRSTSSSRASQSQSTSKEKELLLIRLLRLTKVTLTIPKVRRTTPTSVSVAGFTAQHTTLHSCAVFVGCYTGGLGIATKHLCFPFCCIMCFMQLLQLSPKLVSFCGCKLLKLGAWRPVVYYCKCVVYVCLSFSMFDPVCMNCDIHVCKVVKSGNRGYPTDYWVYIVSSACRAGFLVNVGKRT